MVILTPKHSTPKLYQSPKISFTKNDLVVPKSSTPPAGTAARTTPGSTLQQPQRTVQVEICEKLSTDPRCGARLYETIQSWQESPNFEGPNLLFLEHFSPFLDASHYAYSAVAERFVTESPMMYASEAGSIFGVLQLKKFELNPADFSSIVDTMTTYCPACGCLDIEKDIDEGLCSCWDCDHEFPMPDSMTCKEGSTPSKPISIEISRVLSKGVARLDSRSYKAFGIMLGQVCKYAKQMNVPLLSLNPLDDSLEALYARFGFRRVGLTCYGDRDICAQRAREYINKHRIHVKSGIAH